MKTLLILVLMLGCEMVWCQKVCQWACSSQEESAEAKKYCDECSSACFPGDSVVTLGDGSNVVMKNLKIGERIKSVVDDNIVYTEVKTFLKRRPTDFAIYLAITTKTGQSITLSGSHLVFISSDNSSSNIEPRRAETVKTGEYLFTPGQCPKGLCPSLVTGIELIVKKGAYVPLTDAGTLVVNDIFASCYDTINHDIAHVLATSARWFPWILNLWQENGYSPLVRWGKYLGQLINANSVQFQSLQRSTHAEMKTEL